MAVISTSTMTASRHMRAPSPETVGVEAGNDIPAGRFINVGAVDLVLGHDLLDDKRLRRVPTSSTDRRMKLCWRNDRLESSDGDILPQSWLQLMRCARDRHEQNLELVRSDEGLFVCTIREILQGEELLIWYRETFAREVGVPILTPCHIRGHQKYVCTGCQAVYTHPNTLKAHMFLQCRKSAVSSSTDEDHLVPFHLLLQTLSRSSSVSAERDRKLLHSCRNQRLAMAASSRLLPGCSGCGLSDDKNIYKSAFRSPSSARDVKKEVGSDEGLMTPDSSTDQSSALNLSVKLTEACSSMDQVKDISLHAVHQWDKLTAQHMMAQTLPVPVDFASLAGCYPVPPHLHAFGIQLMNSGQASLPQGHRYDTSFGSSLCNSAEYSLISPHMEDAHDNIGFSLFKPQSSSGSSSVRQVRGNNPYSFTLPSDKEPLDLLPQAYFANKSKKGHLCLCCGKLYSRKYGLKIHMRTHNGYKPLKCKICSRPFGDPSNLNKHVRLHAQGETPYRCDFCGKVLVRRRDLERHVRSRHPMGCVAGDTTLGVCESSPDSSPVSVESSENSLASKDPMYENS